MLGNWLSRNSQFGDACCRHVLFMLAVTFTKIQIGGFPISVALQSMPFKKTHFMHGAIHVFELLQYFLHYFGICYDGGSDDGDEDDDGNGDEDDGGAPLFLHLPLSECGIILAFLQGAA